MPRNDFASQSSLSDVQGWYMYVLYEEDGLYSKIGTAATVKYRLAGLQNGNPRKLILFKSWRLSNRGDAYKISRFALEKAEPKRIPNRDWVLLSHIMAATLVEQTADELRIDLMEVK